MAHQGLAVEFVFLGAVGEDSETVVGGCPTRELMKEDLPEEWLPRNSTMGRLGASCEERGKSTASRLANGWSVCS
jgi:hypothetical protein